MGEHHRGWLFFCTGHCHHGWPAFPVVDLATHTVHRNCLSRLMGNTLQFLIASENHHDRPLQIAVPSRLLLVNRSFIVITFCDARYHCDRSLRTVASSRSPFASCGTSAIAHGKLQFHRDHLTDCGIITTAFSESQHHRNRILQIAISIRSLSASCSFVAITFCGSQDQCNRHQQIAVSSRSPDWLWYHRDCYQWIAASSWWLFRNRGINAIALCESRHPRNCLSWIAVPLRLLSANRGIIVIALASCGVVAIALAICGIIAIALAICGIIAIALAIRGIRMIALANHQVFIAIALGKLRHPCNCSCKSPGLERTFKARWRPDFGESETWMFTEEKSRGHLQGQLGVDLCYGLS